MLNISCLQRIALATIIATVSASCGGNVARNTAQTNANAVDKPKPETNIFYGDLIVKTQSDYLMIPVNITEKDTESENNFKFSRYESKYSKLSNIIFYQKSDGATNLLLNKKALINSFDLLETKSASNVVTRVWLYRIIEQDGNGDQKLNEKDAVIGYISDLSGKNLQQITPNNTQLINWVVIPSQNAIFLKVLKDSDNDKKFTQDDKTSFLRVSLDKPSMGTEIISEQIEQEIKSINK
ncbi:MAG: hypothetical protein KME23_12230 [Goleter apudmare HA4340-LM2]|jgi:hypothetical protein|nr:hypothetical protein [Goleter apudmare HA4340-LM2]